MNKYLAKAKEIFPSMQKDRRHIHSNPEIGLVLPKTKAYVRHKLEEMGLEVKEHGESGLSAVIKGKGQGKTILLRGDMDALPMKEETGLDFKSRDEDKFHGCGHDLHTAMLLGAAQIILENKDSFPGNVKLMFQPAEEIFKGSAMMIEDGILENPKVDAAMALHTALDEGPGSVGYYLGHMTTSCDNFRIDIQGRGGHGAYPHTTIDPINAACLIYSQFGQLISRENPPQATTTLTFGELSAGSSSNIIPDRALMQGTMRTYVPEVREKLKGRMLEILDGVAKTTGSEIKNDFFSGVPSMYSDPELTQFLVDILNRDMPELKTIADVRIMASEDMANIGLEVPTR